MRSAALLEWLLTHWSALSEGWKILWTGIGLAVIAAAGRWLWSRLPGDKAPIKVELSRLPVTDAKLFGRDGELDMLNEAWASGGTNVVALAAMGGAGKTALMNTWLASLSDDYGGAEAVYGWSFYSQGARQDAQALRAQALK